VDDRGRSIEQRTEWEHIAPMTTVVTYLVSHAPPLESSLPIKCESAAVVENPVRRFRVRTRFGTQWGRRSAPLRRLFWPDAPPPLPSSHPRLLPSPSPPPPPPPPLTTPPPPLIMMPPSDREGRGVEGRASRTSEEVGWGDALSVQVAVIIAMPSQRQARSRQLQQVSWSTTLEKDTDPDGTRLGEFCIGTMDVPVPWSECG